MGQRADLALHLKPRLVDGVGEDNQEVVEEGQEEGLVEGRGHLTVEHVAKEIM